MSVTTPTATELRALSDAHSAHNYHPLPVVISRAEGAWVTDVDGRRYVDMLAAYSAINFGHRHPQLVAAARRQLDQVTLVSRAFDHDQFGPFCAELAELAGLDMVLPMNTGAEAVETAIKTARKWGYEVKGVPPGEAVIVAFEGNFHGRTTTIVSFSTDPDARGSYGPYTPGFRVVPYGDADALAAALDEREVGVLNEPIPGEAGVIVPPPGDAAREVRGRGLWAGVEFASMPGRQVSQHLAGRGVLVKDTHGTTIRLAPPLTISEEDLDWALDLLEEMLRNP